MDRASWGRGLLLAQWPEADRRMWDGLVRSGDVFDEAGAFAHCRQVTLDGYRLANAQWLQHLDDEGVDLTAEAPDQRASEQRLRRYLETLAHQSPSSRTHRFAYLCRVLSRAYPEADWRVLKNAANGLNRQKKQAGQDRILDQVPPSDALLDAGLAAISEVRSGSPLTPRQAEQYRNGLLVAMLACHAPRRRTIAALKLGINLRRDREGFAVWASAADMKAGRPFTFRVSSLLTGAVEYYLTHVRPMFPTGGDPDQGPLLLSFITGRALGPQGIGNAVAKITEAYSGHRTMPHAFRYAAMTTMANAEGFDTRHGQAFLGHRTPEVSEQHYNLATQLDAGRAYARLLEQKRKGKIKGKENRG